MERPKNKRNGAEWWKSFESKDAAVIGLMFFPEKPFKDNREELAAYRFNVNKFPDFDVNDHIEYLERVIAGTQEAYEEAERARSRKQAHDSRMFAESLHERVCRKCKKKYTGNWNTHCTFCGGDGVSIRPDDPEIKNYETVVSLIRRQEGSAEPAADLFDEADALLAETGGEEGGTDEEN